MQTFWTLAKPYRVVSLVLIFMVGFLGVSGILTGYYGNFVLMALFAAILIMWLFL